MQPDDAWTLKDYLAISSVFSAIASWAGYLLSRGSALETARPELVIVDCVYDPKNSGEGKTAVIDVTQAGIGIGPAWYGGRSTQSKGKILIGGIKNVGNGVAINCFMDVEYLPRPVAIMTSERFSIISPGDSVTGDMDLTVFWENAAILSEPDCLKMANFKLIIKCSDARGTNYEFTYSMTAFSDLDLQVGGWLLAPGLVGIRAVTRETLWQRRFGALWSPSARRVKAVRDRIQAKLREIADEINGSA